MDGRLVSGPTNHHAHCRSSREVANEGQLVTVAEDCVLRRRKQNIKGEDPATLSLDNDSIYNEQGYLSVIVLPFLLHLGFMSATAFFVMHVQKCFLFASGVETKEIE
ncbi:hypothetical protein LguiA_007730 [Lonicera macranthoides]